MVDNVKANTSDELGPPFATDYDGTEHWPYGKLAWGVHGVRTLVSAADPLPVVQTGTPALPTGAATETTLASVLSALGGTLTMSGTVTATNLDIRDLSSASDSVAAVQSGTWTVGLSAGTKNIGDVDVLTLPGSAHDAAISGNPVRIAGRAMTADYTSVASGDTADLLCDIKGKQVTLPYALQENHWQAVTTAKTDTSDTAIKASAGAGLRNYITSLTVTNSHATVGTVVEVKDGSTVIHRGYAAPAGGGYAVQFPTPLKGAANTAINVANATTGSNTYVSMSGYVAQ